MTNPSLVRTTSLDLEHYGPNLIEAQGAGRQEIVRQAMLRAPDASGDHGVFPEGSSSSIPSVERIADSRHDTVYSQIVRCCAWVIQRLEGIEGSLQ